MTGRSYVSHESIPDMKDTLNDLGTLECKE